MPRTKGRREFQRVHAKNRAEHRGRAKSLENERLQRLASFPELNPSPVLEVDLSGRITYCNPASLHFSNQEGEPADTQRLLPSDMGVILEALRQGRKDQFYRELTVGDRVLGENIYVSPEWKTVRIYISDLTERKRAEKAREVSYGFLEITTRHREIRPLLDEFVEKIRNLTGCSAVGIRMRSQEKDTPCQAYDGTRTAGDRLEECRASLRGECLCTRFMNMDAHRESQKHPDTGSFCVNRISQFSGSESEREILNTPPLKGHSWESVSIVPIRSEDRMLGLLFTADSRRDRISLETLGWLELAAMQIAPVVERMNAEELLHRAHDRLESNVLERTRELAIANRALQAERNKFKNMLDAMEDGVYIVNRDCDIEYVNPALARDFGSVEGRKCHEYLNNLTVPCSWCKSAEVFAGNSVRWEWTASKTGKAYELFDTPVRNDNGTLSKVVILHDVTHQKQAKEALVDSEYRYRTLVETMGEGLGVTDEHFRLVYANDRLCSLLGYSREDLIGHHVSELFERKYLPVLEQQIAHLKQGESLRYEMVALRRDGSALPVLISPRPLLDDQVRFKGSFAIVADLSELKRVEASLRASESHLRSLSFELLRAQEKERRRIAGDLHDDLGQALTSAKLQLAFVRKKLPEGEQELQADCDSAIQHLVQVLEKVRNLSRDLNPIIVEDLGFRAALQWLVDGFARTTGARVSMTVDEIDPLISKEAAVVLYRIFQETLTNIGRHADAKKVSVMIRKQDGDISFSVTDDGKGFKAAEATSGKFAGLGLLTMRERVHMLGGKFHLSSESGSGTRLSFSIPIAGARTE